MKKSVILTLEYELGVFEVPPKDSTNPAEYKEAFDYAMHNEFNCSVISDYMKIVGVKTKNIEEESWVCSDCGYSITIDDCIVVGAYGNGDIDYQCKCLTKKCSCGKTMITEGDEYVCMKCGRKETKL